MANRPAPIRQADATRLLKAAMAAGYGRARIVTHPDGRIELVAETVRADAADIVGNDWDEVLNK